MYKVREQKLYCISNLSPALIYSYILAIPLPSPLPRTYIFLHFSHPSLLPRTYIFLHFSHLSPLSHTYIFLHCSHPSLPRLSSPCSSFLFCFSTSFSSIIKRFLCYSIICIMEAYEKSTNTVLDLKKILIYLFDNDQKGISRHINNNLSSKMLIR